MNGGTAPQWLAGPSSLGGTNGAAEGGAISERSGPAQGDLTSSDYSVISGRTSDVNGMSAVGSAFTDSMAAGLTPASAAEFIYALLQQNKHLKESLNVSNRRMTELVALIKKQKTELQSKDEVLQSKESELKLRNQQCKLRFEELTAESQRAMSELQKHTVQDKSLSHANDSLYKTGVVPVAETGQVEASGNGCDPVGLQATFLAEADYATDYSAASETANAGNVKGSEMLIHLRNEVAAKSTKISDLVSACASKDEEISRLAKQIFDLQDQIMTLREHDDQLTMKLAQDLNKLDANADVLRRRDAEIRDLTHRNSDLQQKVEEFRGQNNKLQTQVSSLASRVTSLQEEITGLQQRRGELAQSERNAEVEELRNKLETSEKKCNSILQQWAEMSSDSEKLKKDRDVDSQRYDQLMLKHNTSEAALMAERRENARVRQILNERTLRLDELKRTYEDVLKELNETTKRQNQAELKEQIDEYRMLLQQAEQLAERRGIDLTDLRRQLHNHEEEMRSIVVLKHQLEVYRIDFEAERKAREEKHAEADRLQQQLEQLQLRYQQLVDELEAYSIRHLDDMRRRHGQPPASAPAAAAGYDPFSRASPALGGSNVPGSGSGLGVAGPAAAQPGRLVGGGGSVAQQWSTAVRPQPTMLAETEQGDYAPRDRQPRVVHQRLPGSASDSQMEYGADTRLGYAPAQQEQQRPPTFQLFPRQQLPQQQPPMQQPLHVPQLQPGRADSFRCPVCNIEVPDFDSLNVHVNECIDLNGGN